MASWTHALRGHVRLAWRRSVIAAASPFNGHHLSEEFPIAHGRVL